MDRRFSMSSTHIANPIAESTCLTLNGTNSNSAFQWGGSPISSKSRSNSSGCLFSGNSSSSAHTSHNGTSSPHRTKANRSKIDPRIYADVQSKGLASRIVKYHENGSRLSRSMSVSNLYNRLGQFPVVHLKKQELPYKATKQNLSMTRIPAPVKSMFYGNTLPSLMHSNSVLGFAKTDEEISRENRPILHPPPTESELAPTRSVLDVLKEISRKRINSDELDVDAGKKYCNRDIADNVESAPVRQVREPNMPQSYKRQREKVPYHYQPTTQHPTFAAHNRSDGQHSPEQIAKRRLCSYNNDITSSLSSSIIHTNKRKFIEQSRTTANEKLHSTKNAAAATPTTEVNETQKSKIQRQQNELRFDHLSKNLNCTTPITPIPVTPLNQTVSETHSTHPTAKSVPPHRTISEPIYPMGNTSARHQAIKPKLTLFNKNYEESTKKVTTEQANDATAVDGESAGIMFVKPKKLSAISGMKNPLIERTQKSKLALMLCGLRGELYQGGDDLDGINKHAREIIKETKKLNESNPPTTTSAPITGFVLPPAAVVSTSSATLTFSTTTTTATTTKSSIVEVSGSKPEVAPSPSILQTSLVQPTKTPIVGATPTLGGFQFTPPSSTAVPKMTSPLVGIKLAPQTAAMSSNTNAAEPAPTFALGTSPVNSTQSVPTPTFSFGLSPPKSTSSATPSMTTTTTSASVPILCGFPLNASINSPKPAPEATSSITGTTASSSGFTFGTPTAANATASAVSTLSKESSNNANTTGSTPLFNFGNIGAANTVAPVFGAVATTTTTSPTFAAPTPTFGSMHPPNNTGSFAFNKLTPSVSGPEITNSATSIPTFGASALFGGSANSFIAPAAAPTFAFGSTVTTAAATPTTVTMPSTTNTFSFGSTAQKPTAAAAPFSFNTPAPPAPSAVNNTFAFGSPSPTVVTTSNSNNFSFGSAATGNSNSLATTKSFAFGSGTAPVNPPIFGGAGAAGVSSNNATNMTIAAPALAFGAVTGVAQQQQPPPPPAFGSASTATSTSSASPSFTFGVKADNSLTTGAFSFNAASNSTPSSTGALSKANIFGSSSATSTNIVKPSFSFGGAVTSSADTSKPLFGAAASTISAGNSTFGSLTAASSTNQAKTFSFGSNNKAAAQPVAPGLFGGSAEASPKPAAGSFSFGAGANTAAIQNKPTAAASAFSFGSSGSAGTNGTSANAINKAATPFSFGSTAPNTSSANKPFAFGSGGSNSTATAPAAPAFNFSSSVGTVSTSKVGVAIPNGNIFAPAGNVAASPSDRPIRRATRRLQKS